MAYDDSTGGIARRIHHDTTPTWGDDWGDRSPRCLLDALHTSRERSQVDHLADQKRREKWAEIAADATRRRSAPVEARIMAERPRKETALSQAFAKAKKRDKKR